MGVRSWWAEQSSGMRLLVVILVLIVGFVVTVVIVVILAAVLGAFVLGLGDGGTTVPPAAQMECEQTEGDFIIRHAEGDSIVADRITVQGPGIDADAVSKPTGRFEPGDTIIVEDVQQGSDVRLVWLHPDSERSSVLLSCPVR